MKTCLQVKDDFTMLNGDNTAGGETAAITETINFVENWCTGVAWTQEVRMQ